jgi:hypothetical protein
MEPNFHSILCLMIQTYNNATQIDHLSTYTQLVNEFVHMI